MIKHKEIFFRKDGQEIKGMKGMKPIIDIWTNVINNEDAFINKKNEDKDLPIQLEKKEIFHLYEILGLDKAKVLQSYLKGENNNPEEIIYDIELSVFSFFLILTQESTTRKGKYAPKNINKKCTCAKCEFEEGNFAGEGESPKHMGKSQNYNNNLKFQNKTQILKSCSRIIKRNSSKNLKVKRFFHFFNEGIHFFSLYLIYTYYKIKYLF